MKKILDKKINVVGKKRFQNKGNGNDIFDLFYQKKVNSAFDDITKLILEPDIDLKDISQLLYKKLLEIVGCKHGYVGVIQEEGLILNIHTFSLMMKECGIEKFDPKFDISKLNNIFSNSIKEGKSFFTNNPSSHHWSSGIPTGHVKLDSLLIVSKKNSQIALANKDGGFTKQDFDLIDRISNVFEIAIQRFYFENKLKTQKNLYKGIFENSLVGIVKMDTNRVIKEVNNKLLEIFKYSKDELLDQKSNILHINQDSYKKFGQIVADLVKNGELIDIEYPFLCKNGNEIICRISGKLVDIIDYNQGIIRIIEDITEKKLKDKFQKIMYEILDLLNKKDTRDIKVINNILDLLIDNIHIDGIGVRKIVKGKFEFLASKGFKFDLDNIHTSNCLCKSLVFGDGFMSDLLTKYGSLIINDLQNSELLNKIGCGDVAKYNSLALIPIKSDEKIIGLFQIGSKKINFFSNDLVILLESIGGSIGVEIERREFESQLYQSEQEKKNIIEGLGEGIIVQYFDKQMNLIRASPNIEQMFICGNKNFANKKCYELIQGKETLCDNCSALKAMNTGKVEYNELELQNGNYYYTISTPTKNIDGEVSGVIHVAINITDLKLKELELICSKEKAEESQLLKENFLAMVTHEFRTPINAIIGGVQAIEFENNIEDVPQRIEIIKVACNNLGYLVNDLLDSSKIKNGKLNLIQQDFNINNELSKIKDMLLLSSEKEGIKINIDLNTNIWVNSDSVRLKQIIINLISNSIKFTNKGIISLHSYYEQMGEIYNVKFIIEDTGIGIELDKLNNIFDQFFQIEDTYTRKYGGLGLGLFIVKNIVDLMGGKIYVESKKGVGTKFFINLPIKSSDYSNIIENLGNSDIEILKPMNILIVDDEIINQKMLSGLLGKYGHLITIAENGKQALYLINKTKFDLIVMDIQMPEMDGITTTKLIRQKGIETPIIALTGLGQEKDKLNCLQAGMNEYVEKPVDLREFLQVINKFKSTN